MKTKKTTAIQALVLLALSLTLALAFTACSGGSGGGGKSLNSATELKEYLDKQPANSPSNPIKVAMKANEMMIKDIAKVIIEAGKYVSLDLSGSPLTEIPHGAFNDYDYIKGKEGCKTLVGITIPSSVTFIGNGAFDHCINLTSVTIGNSVTSIGGSAFDSNQLTSVTIPNSVTAISGSAFTGNPLTSVTIGENVTLGSTQPGPFGVYYFNSIPGNFDTVYNNGGKKAGKYICQTAGENSVWSKQN